jgi:hypothetical protein
LPNLLRIVSVILVEVSPSQYPRVGSNHLLYNTHFVLDGAIRDGGIDERIVERKNWIDGSGRRFVDVEFVKTLITTGQEACQSPNGDGEQETSAYFFHVCMSF